MVDPTDRRTMTRARLEAAQDEFVIALRRLRGLEQLAARLRAPLDLESAHDLWATIVNLPGEPEARRPDVDRELQAARRAFLAARETLRCAEAEAALAAERTRSPPVLVGPRSAPLRAHFVLRGEQ